MNNNKRITVRYYEDGTTSTEIISPKKAIEAKEAMDLLRKELKNRNPKTENTNNIKNKNPNIKRKAPSLK